MELRVKHFFNQWKKATKKSFCKYVYQPIWYLLLTVGIDGRSFTEAPTRGFPARFLLASLAAFYCSMTFVYLVIVNLYIICCNSSIIIGDICFVVSANFICIIILSMFFSFIWRRNKFVELYFKLNRASQEILRIDSNDYEKLRRFVWKCLFLSFFSIQIVILTGVLDYFAREEISGPKVSVAAMFKKSTLFQGNNSLHFEIVITFISVAAFLTVAGQALFFLNYVVTAKSILENFERLETSHEEWMCGKELFEEHQVLKLIKNHHLLCEVVRLFDEAFREMVLIWNIVDVFNLLTFMWSINLNEFWNVFASDKQSIVIIIATVFKFVFKVIVGAGINDKILTSLRLINAATYADFTDKSTCKIGILCDMYCSSIQADPPLLTGWKLYDINEGVILKVFAGVMTYVLVLYNVQSNYVISSNSYTRFNVTLVQ